MANIEKFQKAANEKSPFAQAIRALLDDTNFFDRKSWAAFLDVPEATILTWVNDEALPRPDRLRMILDLLRLRGRNQQPVEKFDSLIVQSPNDISPLGFMMLPTVNDYLKLSVLDFARMLKDMPHEEVQWAIKNL